MQIFSQSTVGFFILLIEPGFVFVLKIYLKTELQRKTGGQRREREGEREEEKSTSWFTSQMATMAQAGPG